MRGRVWIPDDIELLVRKYAHCSSVAELAKELGRSEVAVQQKARKLGLRWLGPKRFEVEELPERNRPIEEILSDQAKRFKAKKARSIKKREGIRIELEDPGPYAILFFGDPHADDNGCDIERLSFDLEFARSKSHVYSVNMGDLTNNWIGRLGRLYAKQNTTEDEAEDLIEWLVGYLDWLFVILGNHDKWGPLAQRICKDHRVTSVSHGAKFRVFAGNDPEARELVIDARHNHKGHSMYHSTHGPLKKAYRGSPADIIIAAHTHTSGYLVSKNGQTSKIAHCIRVGAYKQHDDFAEQLDFDEEQISPSVLAVVDPQCGTEEGFVHIFHDIEQGGKFLDALRAGA